MVADGRGFTLIELMVTIAVAAILAAIAFPSFESVMRSNQVTTATNGMIAAISFARSEAIRGSQKMQICPSADGATCGALSDWNQGWLVLPEGGAAIRFIDANPKINTVLTAGSSTITFDSRGRPLNNATQRVFTLRPTVCSTGQPYVRTVTITASGATNVTKANCT